MLPTFSFRIPKKCGLAALCAVGDDGPSLRSDLNGNLLTGKQPSTLPAPSIVGERPRGSHRRKGTQARAAGRRRGKDSLSCWLVCAGKYAGAPELRVSADSTRPGV